MWPEVDNPPLVTALAFTVGFVAFTIWTIVATCLRYIQMDTLECLASDPVDSGRRAERLLQDCLTAEEWEQLTIIHYLEIPSRLHEGRIYQIPQDGSIVSVLVDGQLMERLCVEPQDPVPSADKVLALKLLIEGDEERYLSIANRLPIGRGRGIADVQYRYAEARYNESILRHMPLPPPSPNVCPVHHRYEAVPTYVLYPETTLGTGGEANQAITYTDADLHTWFTHDQDAQRSFRNWLRLRQDREQARSVVQLANGSTVEGVQLDNDLDPTQLGPIWDDLEIQQALENDPLMCEILIREVARRAGVPFPYTPSGLNDGQAPQP